MSKFARFFAIQKEMKQLGLNADRADLIDTYTDGAKSSLTDLTPGEYTSMLTWLCQTFLDPAKSEQSIQKTKELKQRHKIIANFAKMGYKNPLTGKADMKAINEWCEKYGHLHKPLNSYKGADLTKLVTQANNVFETYLTGVWKRPRLK